jgi:polyphenol oxidase
MLELLEYLGDQTLPYRTIMAEHTDFVVQDCIIPKKQVVIAEQTHSNRVHKCTGEDGGAGFDEHSQIMDCDALVTNLPNVFLLIRTADCTPILLYDEKSRSIGAIHSGREGTRKNIAGETIKTMVNSYSAQPENIRAVIGAGICKKHYHVSEAVWQEFFLTCQKQGVTVREADFPRLDIQDVIYQQLMLAGLQLCNIKTNQICTFESNSHFSFRRDGTHNRQINLIGLIDGKYHL